MKSLCFLVAIVAVSAEPPVDNRYLPPLQDYQDYRGGGGITPSQNYGPPGSGAGHQRQTDALFGSRKTSYDAAINYRPSTQYGPPQSQYNPNSQHSPSSQYGPPQSQYSPNSQYSSSSQSQTNSNSQYSPSSQYGPPQSQPSSQYGAPSGFNPSSRPSSQYGALGSNGRKNGLRQNDQSSGTAYESHSSGSGFGFVGGQQQSQGRFGSNPSNAYGPPDQNRRYLPPGGGYGEDDGSNGEPANYKFEYMVKDDESRNDFGHGESRQGDRAEGWYYVVLPDGRKQTVEYVADQDGYKPRISYEDTGAGVGGYDRNSQRGFDNNGPY